MRRSINFLAACALSALPSIFAIRTVADCVANLNCALSDLYGLSVVQRKDIVSQIQATYGPQFNASDRWNNVLGTSFGPGRCSECDGYPKA